MKKSLRNFVLACTATAAVSLALATSAFAADFPAGSLTYDQAAGTVTVASTVFESLSGQTTILIYDKAVENPAELTGDQILYINQDDAANTTTFAGMGLKGGLQEGKTYVVKIGGENMPNGILVGEVTVGEGGAIKVQLGDVNGDTFIDVSDINPVIQHILGAAVLTGKDFVAADTATDGIVDVSDINPIIQHILGAAPLGEVDYTPTAE